jgi:cobalt-zinc-cadmium efflux system protein
MAFEVVTAFLSHSLALLADAGHMLADVGAIAGSLGGAAPGRAARDGFAHVRHEAGGDSGRRRQRHHTARRLGARHLRGHRAVGAPGRGARRTLIVVAAVGVAVNVVATLTLSKANRRSLNIEGAYRHVVTDLYGFIGTVVAGIVIVTTGFSRADSIASLVVVALMLKAALRLLRPGAAHPSGGHAGGH